MPILHINFFAVLLAAVVGHFLGALWYSPYVFGKAWMKLSGIDEARIEAIKQKGLKKTYLASFALLLIMSFVLGFAVDYGLATTVGGGVKVALLCWLGFVLPVVLGGVLWEGKPPQLILLNAGHYAVVLAAMGAIQAIWA